MYKTSYRCEGKRQKLVSEPKSWNISFGSMCSQLETGHTINLDYTITFSRIHESFPYKLNHPICRKFVEYDEYIVPNILGQTSAIKIRDNVNIMLLAAETASCYKNLYLIACTFMFPTVTSKGLV